MDIRLTLNDFVLVSQLLILNLFKHKTSSFMLNFKHVIYMSGLFLLKSVF